MKKIIRKIITLIITLLCISFLTFSAFAIIPGDAAANKLGKEATAERIEQLREEMGLNDPLPVRYGRWLSGAVQGDFGESYRYDGRTVQSLIARRLPITMLLAGISLVIIIIVSVPLGILSARFSGRFVDIFSSHLTQVIMAVPSFFLGILMTYVFGLVLHWYQPGTFVSPDENLWASLQYLFFPALAIALPKIAMTMRFLRNSVLTEMRKDYVRTATSKGMDENRILYHHVLKNALIPVVTFVAMVVAEILAGSLVVEQVFSVPGIGILLISSISSRDYPVVQALVLYITSVVVILNFLVDVIYEALDPRVRV
ncbi:ABC transporter permease [[Clostridium] aminophilum]|uniref:ABC transporter permease n=1 Tax=[Clostridium] aminophilum TaxID=1526 RepID=UPI003F96F524